MPILLISSDRYQITIPESHKQNSPNLPRLLVPPAARPASVNTNSPSLSSRYPVSSNLSFNSCVLSPSSLASLAVVSLE